MAYCTQANIEGQLTEEELIQLTDDVNAGVIDATNLAQAIADADAEINTYCGARYAVPFATTPVIVRKWSVDITIYNLYTRRAFIDMPEIRKDRYDDAIRALKDIAKGLGSLGADDPGSSTSGETVRVTTVKTDRVFSIGRASDGSTGTLDNF